MYISCVYDRILHCVSKVSSMNKSKFRKFIHFEILYDFMNPFLFLSIIVELVFDAKLKDIIHNFNILDVTTNKN